MPSRDDSEPVASPCVDICTIDPDSGYCLGCKRTLDEIAGWMSYSKAQQLDVLCQLDEREIVRQPD